MTAPPTYWTMKGQREYEGAVKRLTALLVKPKPAPPKRKCTICDAFKPCDPMKFMHGKAFVCADCSPCKPVKGEAETRERGWRVAGA